MTTTIPPWTRVNCSECGCDSLATRTEQKTITGPYVCSDCKLVEQAEVAATSAAYERMALWCEEQAADATARRNDPRSTNPEYRQHQDGQEKAYRAVAAKLRET